MSNLDKVRSLFDKQFADKENKDADLVYVTWDKVTNDDSDRRSTGSLLLDDLLGGGYRSGGISQWYGPESGGKTAIISLIVSTYQKLGLPVLYIDAENAFDGIYTLKTFGFNVFDKDTVIFSQEETTGTIYQMVEMAAQNGFGACVIDSTDSMTTPAEEEAEYDQAMMTQKARVNSLALAKLKGILKQNKCDLIGIAQIRDGNFGNPKAGTETVSGGRAWKYYSTYRNRVSKVEILEDKDGNAIGQRIKVVNKKNKAGIPFKEVELDLYYNVGFDLMAEVIDLAAEHNVIEKGGAWYSYPYKNSEKSSLQGKPNVIKYFKENIEEYNHLRNQVISKMKESRTFDYKAYLAKAEEKGIEPFSEEAPEEDQETQPSKKEKRGRK